MYLKIKLSRQPLFRIPWKLVWLVLSCPTLQIPPLDVVLGRRNVCVELHTIERNIYNPSVITWRHNPFAILSSTNIRVQSCETENGVHLRTQTPKERRHYQNFIDADNFMLDIFGINQRNTYHPRGKPPA
jgi:hypothetical protein